VRWCCRACLGARRCRRCWCAAHQQRRPLVDCGPDALIAGRRVLPRRGYIHADGPTPSRPLGLQNRPELWANSPPPLASARDPPSESSAAIGCSNASESCQVLLPAISSRDRLVTEPPAPVCGGRVIHEPSVQRTRAPTAGMKPIIPSSFGSVQKSSRSNPGGHHECTQDRVAGRAGGVHRVARYWVHTCIAATRRRLW
jgi:hypothetical protein